jgi:hypothetical protein
MDTQTIATVLGYVLFGLSELLPLLPIPTNGFLHSIFIGLQNAFRNPTKDIEMAMDLVSNKNFGKDFANIVNSLANNNQLNTIVLNLINNPQLANNINSIQNDTILLSQLPRISSNPQIKNLISTLLQDPTLSNNLSLALNNPTSKQLLQNLPFVNPQLTNVLNSLVSGPQSNSIINLIDQVNANPTLLNTFNTERINALNTPRI